MNKAAPPQDDPSACRPELTLHEHVRLADGSSRRSASASHPRMFLNG